MILNVIQEIKATKHKLGNKIVTVTKKKFRYVSI